MLSSSDVVKRYAEEFAIVEIDFRFRRGVDTADNRPEIERYNHKQYRPVMVVLDAGGNKVFKQTGGFNNQMEATLLADYITGKHYREKKWKAYLSENFK